MGKRSNNPYSGLSREEYIRTEKHCKNCGKVFYEAWNKGGDSPFCSCKCARGFSTKAKRKDINKLVSQTLKGKITGAGFKKCGCSTVAELAAAYMKKPKKCAVCGRVIPFEKRKCKTCSPECSQVSRRKSLKSNKNHSGGYREGSGRSKSGYFDDIFMGSTYELAYYIFQRDHGKQVVRNEKTFSYVINGKKHTYLPDFIVDGVYIEIKGYHNPVVDVKLEAVRKAGYEIQIFYIADLLHMMDYIDEQYGTHHRGKYNNYQTLYQDYKPKYEYKCDYCGKEFTTDSKRRTVTGMVFCSLECAGKGKFSNGRLKPTEETRKRISESLKRYNAARKNS